MDSPLKWHGGKHYLAPKLWDIAKAVPHVHRVEVFGGSLAFTLATEPEGFSEVVNDANSDLMTFWDVLKVYAYFVQFRHICEMTPFSEHVFHQAVERLAKSSMPAAAPGWANDRIERAWAFFVTCRQSMAGRMKNFAPLTKRRTRRGMNEQASAWISAVDGLQEVHNRLIRVAVRNRQFSDLIPSEDSESTLFYCDPPYLHSTRSTIKEYGHFEMDEDQHHQLLGILSNIKGKFMLSGYQSQLYGNFATRHQWRCIEFELPNNSASGSTKERKAECVWCNF